jgi:RNA polymerase sigma-70 factor, ECF subfamily
MFGLHRRIASLGDFMTSTLAKQSSGDAELSFQPSEEQATGSQFFASLRAGDETASATLVRNFGGRLLAVARRFLRCEEDCADAVQDAFLSAFRSLEQFEGKSSVGTWLHRIVVNSCLMKLRVQSRSRAVPIDDLLPAFDEAGYHNQLAGMWEEQGLLRLTREETRNEVRACIDRLPHSYRAVLLLRDIEELDTLETALRLGIAPGAVKTRLHRARQALRMLLMPVVANEEDLQCR